MKARVTGDFIVIPKHPYPLLERDLLHKLRAQIIFKDDTINIDFLIRGSQTLESSNLRYSPPGEEYLLNCPPPWGESPGMPKELPNMGAPIKVPTTVGKESLTQISTVLSTNHNAPEARSST